MFVFVAAELDQMTSNGPFPLKWFHGSIVSHLHPNSGASGPASNTTGTDLLGISCEKAISKDAWWPLNAGESWSQLTSPKGLGAMAMINFPNVWFPCIHQIV